MKITKAKLKQIIKEELVQEMESRSTKNQLALMVYNIETALDRGDPNMDSVNSLISQLSNYIQDNLPDDEKHAGDTQAIGE
jgi:hypothetical protein